MNEKVKEFLDAKKAEERKKYEKEKADTLLELGLYEKEYSPTNSYSAEYPYSEWDEDAKTNKYYKKAGLKVSDEEYEEIKKYNKKAELLSSNPVASILRIIAVIIFIGGFIAGIALGTVEVERGYLYTYTDTEFSFAIAFIYWAISFISGMMFIGFAEIINLLDEIKKKK